MKKIVEMGFATVFGFAILLWIFLIYDIQTSTLAPLGILTSALLAALSVMRNIENTNKIEEVKRLAERANKRIYTRHLCKRIVYVIDGVETEIQNDHDLFLNYIQLILSTLDSTVKSLVSDTVVPYIDEEEQQDAIFIFRLYYHIQKKKEELIILEKTPIDDNYRNISINECKSNIESSCKALKDNAENLEKRIA